MDASNVLESMAPIHDEAVRLLGLWTAFTQVAELEDESEGETADAILAGIMRSITALASLTNAATQRPPEPDESETGGACRRRRRHGG